MNTYDIAVSTTWERTTEHIIKARDIHEALLIAERLDIADDDQGDCVSRFAEINANDQGYEDTSFFEGLTTKPRRHD